MSESRPLTPVKSGPLALPEDNDASDVDETLLAWTLGLTPFERLDASVRAGLALDELRSLSRSR